MRKLLYSFVAAAAVALPAYAVSTSLWSHTTEADFKAGTFDNVVATNLGDLKLSRATRTLLQQDPRVSAVYALAQAPDGTVYAATGPQGVLLSVKNDKVETAAVIDEHSSLFSTIVDDKGRVLIGTGGEKGRGFAIDKPGDKPKQIFEADGVQYIWALRQTPDGAIYAATGPNGQLFEIKPDGSHKAIFDSDENNLLSLTGDGKDLLFVGTDPNGHVYRVNRKTGEAFVIYDAAESEVAALAMDAKGNLYAGTAQSTGQEGPDTSDEGGATDKVGRPEEQKAAKAIPIPSEPPKAPEPPKIPLPGPGDPQPIPRTSTSQRAAGNAAVLPALKPAIYLSAAPGDEPGGDPGEP